MFNISSYDGRTNRIIIRYYKQFLGFYRSHFLRQLYIPYVVVPFTIHRSTVSQFLLPLLNVVSESLVKTTFNKKVIHLCLVVSRVVIHIIRRKTHISQFFHFTHEVFEIFLYVFCECVGFVTSTHQSTVYTHLPLTPVVEIRKFLKQTKTLVRLHNG